MSFGVEVPGNRNFAGNYRSKINFKVTAHFVFLWRLRIIGFCQKLTFQMKATKRKGDDVTRYDSQRRFLAQHSVAMLEQCCKYSKQCQNNVATLCYAKNRCCESSR